MIKQVLVIRKDLKMRRGKECSQIAHASMMWLLERIKKSKNVELSPNRRRMDKW